MSISHLTLEVTDPTAAAEYYATAFGLGDLIRVRATDAPTEGFRGYSISLVVEQPYAVDSYAESAIAGGATVLKPVAKSFWGYGGVVQDPFGTIWKFASSEKKNTGPLVRAVKDVVLGIGVADVAVTKRFYVEQGLTVAKSFGRKYVEFDSAPIKLALYGRKFAAKESGVPMEGGGSRRLAIGGTAAYADPDGFVWERATAPAAA